MINLNYKKQDLNLVIVNNKKLPKFVNEAIGSTTLISEEKTIYMVVDFAANKVRRSIKEAFAIFVGANKFNVNIDIDTVVKSIGKGMSKQEVFNTIYETIAFYQHQLLVIKKENKPKPEINYNLLTTDQDLIKFEANEKIKTEYINFARDLQDTPPNIGTSVYMAEHFEKEAKKVKNLKVTVLTKKDAEKLGMGLFLSVNAGSSVEGRIVVLEYITDPSLEKTALIGKGICFDSGGYNLKPSNFMSGMKYDMSGAAIMLSSVMALAKAGAKANVVAVGMFTDNRISSTATLPESIIKSMNGLTVQIDNTDAEGRLVLADGITYAIRELKADRIYDAATLTGAIRISLGRWATGVFTRDEGMWREWEKVSQYSGERMWRLPIFDEHLEKMQKAAPQADLSNAEKGGEAGSSTAAAFLNEFAEGKPFMHLDIASTADIESKSQGVLINTIFELLNK